MSHMRAHVTVHRMQKGREEVKAVRKARQAQQTGMRQVGREKGIQAGRGSTPCFCPSASHTNTRCSYNSTATEGGKRSERSAVGKGQCGMQPWHPHPNKVDRQELI